MSESLSKLVPETLAQKTVAAGAVVFGTRWLCHKISDYRESCKLARKRQKARDYKENSIKQMITTIQGDKFALADKDVITKLPPLEIVQKIKKGELTCMRVLRAFQAKALECHEKTNALCYFFEEAEQWAEERDADPKKEGRLFGLPISIKDHFTMEGYSTLYGCARLVDHPAEKTCAFVKCFIREGAVPFIRTNVPQLMMSIEGSNPIYGATRNPHDPSRGTGGSSSGEGAMVGYGASPLGLGSDIGGSVRHPANFCGCQGFKPTTYRASQRDAPRFSRGQTAVNETFGPLAADVATIVEACKCLWDDPQMFEYDTKIPPLMFNHQLYESAKPLKIGIYYDLPGAVPLVPGVRRALDMVKLAVEAQGHTVVPWSPPPIEKVLKLFYSIMLAHGGVPWLEDIKNDELDPAIAYTVGELKKSYWRKKITAFIQSFYNDMDSHVTNAGTGIQSAQGYFDKYEQLQDFRDAIDDSWREQGIDACINPPMPFPAMFLYNTGTMTSEYLYLGGIIYSSMYNILCLPAGIVQVTKMSVEDVKNMDNYPTGDPVLDNIQVGMKGSEGLPLSCQVVGRRFRDETALRLMKEIESQLHKL